MESSAHDMCPKLKKKKKTPQIKHPSTYSAPASSPPASPPAYSLGYDYYHTPYHTCSEPETRTVVVGSSGLRASTSYTRPGLGIVAVGVIVGVSSLVGWVGARWWFGRGSRR